MQRKDLGVSTHSRLKAAGGKCAAEYAGLAVSTHSRLKAAGKASGEGDGQSDLVSTHSRLKAAG